MDSDSRSSFRYYPINTPGPVDCVNKDSKPHDYFLHLFWEEFLVCKGISTLHFKIICPLLGSPHSTYPYQQISHPNFSLLKKCSCEIKFYKNELNLNIHVKQQHNVGFFIFKFTLKYMLGNVYI